MNKLTPYKHQNEAINKVLIEFEKEDRTQLIKSCGTGKSLTSMCIKYVTILHNDKNL